MKGLEVSLAKEICPICGKEMDGPIIMNTIISEKEANKVKALHGNIIGASENACEECAKYKDDVVYVIETDNSKYDSNKLNRTGKIWGIRKDFALFVENPEYIAKTKNGVSFTFMEKQLTTLLKLNNENN